tara:strand:- start:624 stop:1286 length:663 start_codon:yes stop_codon:yes gene_type:complete
MAKKIKQQPIEELRLVMARLRGPDGCPWDREQDHESIKLNSIEEVYELVDAIESGNDEEMLEELGDLLLQVVFHAQMAEERGSFNFEQIVKTITDKLIRRHPHVFGDVVVRDVDGVWNQWEAIKLKEKIGKPNERKSVFDGIPRHLPALMRAHEVVKKGRKRGLLPKGRKGNSKSKKQLGEELYRLVQKAQANGWQAEVLLRAEIGRREKSLRKKEKSRQ